jgi:thiamine-monophosphate kinase
VTEDSITRKLRKHSTLIGDDCAIIRPRANEDLLFTTDFTIEGVHFTTEAKPENVGQRALARSLSDIAAMGGTPRYCLVSLALAPWTTARWIDAFYRGVLKLADATGTKLAGGDLSHSDKLTCDVMACGSVPRGKALRRSGAKVEDMIYVSGPLGGWRHRPVIEPRLELGRRLVGKAHACIDITDGLALDLHRLSLESGLEAHLSSIPLLPGATLDEALHDGEDYELLYTSSARVPGIQIGSFKKGKPGTIYYQNRKIKPRGYDHLQHRT